MEKYKNPIEEQIEKEFRKIEINPEILRNDIEKLVRKDYLNSFKDYSSMKYKNLWGWKKMLETEVMELYHKTDLEQMLRDSLSKIGVYNVNFCLQCGYSGCPHDISTTIKPIGQNAFIITYDGLVPQGDYHETYKVDRYDNIYGGHATVQGKGDFHKKINQFDNQKFIDPFRDLNKDLLKW